MLKPHVGPPNDSKVGERNFNNYGLQYLWGWQTNKHKCWGPRIVIIIEPFAKNRLEGFKAGPGDGLGLSPQMWQSCKLTSSSCFLGEFGTKWISRNLFTLRYQQIVFDYVNRWRVTWTEMFGDMSQYQTPPFHGYYIYIYYIMSMSEIAVYLPSYHCKKKTILISALKQKNAPKQTLYINVGVTRQNISLMWWNRGTRISVSASHNLISSISKISFLYLGKSSKIIKEYGHDQFIRLPSGKLT